MALLKVNKVSMVPGRDAGSIRLTTAALEADGVQTLADAGLAMLGTTACSLRDHYCLCTLAWMEALSKWSTVLLC